MRSRRRFCPFVFLLAGGLVFLAGSRVQATPISAIEDGFEWFFDLFGIGSSDSGGPAHAPPPDPPSGGEDMTGPPGSGLPPPGGPGPQGPGNVGGDVIDGDDLGPQPPPQGPAPAVPEPATVLLSLAGLAGLASLKLRKKSA